MTEKEKKEKKKKMHVAENAASCKRSVPKGASTQVVHLVEYRNRPFNWQRRVVEALVELQKRCQAENLKVVISITWAGQKPQITSHNQTGIYPE